jgi:hypothetical protein
MNLIWGAHMRKQSRSFLLLLMLASMLTAFSGCAKISLTKPASPGQVGKSVPPLDGNWTIQFEYKGEGYESTVDLAQQGSQVVGRGQDSTGAAFTVEQGRMNGENIHFLKQYPGSDASTPPVDYTGTLTWTENPDYKGWILGGRYQTTSNGNKISGKWVATPNTPIGGGEPPGGPTAAAPSQGTGFGGPPSTSGSPPPSGAPPSAMPPQQAGGDASDSPQLSGLYQGAYEFNFKKVTFKMWLEQDGEHVAGHGVDTNTNEQFQITKGWYHFPKLTLSRHYQKGKSAATTRDIIFKCEVARDFRLKGKTQYGGEWDAQLVR